ncbi:hypothetical protein [Sphingomonas bacterium]|uniref:hypothetical protein n=1 Tax=Sphingomonas bacterium TaxID=1895847 RepID=UPI0015757B1E|nr:hypothetical protein [Sphingomonas bacterium]
MTLDFTTVIRDAWTLFRRDRDILLRIAGPFLFLPAYALALLVPAPPTPDAAAADSQVATQAWVESIGDWGAAHGGWFLLSYAIAYVGGAAMLSLYLDPAQPDVRGALRRAVSLAPRFLLAMFALTLPAGLGLLLWVIPGLVIMGRTMLVAPVLIADRPIGVLAAIARGWRMGRGASLSLTALSAFTYVTGWIASVPLLALDNWLRTGADANPVPIAIVDAAAAAVATASGLAGTIVALAAYRRLAR